MNRLARRTAWVTVVSAVLGLAMLPLAQTEWADANRPSASGEHDSEPREEGGDAPPRLLMLVLPFVKVGILMGVPALFVLGASAGVRRVRR